MVTTHLRSHMDLAFPAIEAVHLLVWDSLALCKRMGVHVRNGILVTKGQASTLCCKHTSSISIFWHDSKHHNYDIHLHRALMDCVIFFYTKKICGTILNIFSEYPTFRVLHSDYSSFTSPFCGILSFKRISKMTKVWKLLMPTFRGKSPTISKLSCGPSGLHPQETIH